MGVQRPPDWIRTGAWRADETGLILRLPIGSMTLGFTVLLGGLRMSLSRRATLLTLTAAGKRKLTAARKKRHKVIEDLLKDWSPAQVKTFASQVSKFNKLSD